jgi:cobalt-zinc-cadmium efflux system membrane fusion protein
MKKESVFIAAIVAITLIVGGLLMFTGRETDHAHDEHGSHAETEEAERGPNGGRMLRDGDFAIEITIFEDGVPPEFHVYAFNDDDAVAPKDVQLKVQLKRLDGESNTFAFAPHENYLKGNGEVQEPHSFDVAVSATYKGKAHTWSYASYEGRTTIAPAAAAEAGVTAEAAGPATITSTVTLTGRITLDPSRAALVRARFPGIVKEVRKNIGDPVQAGDLLAVIESNESLQPYQLRAPIAGRITRRMVTAGAMAGQDTLFEIADTRQVVAEFNVFPRHLTVIKELQPVTVKAMEGDAVLDTKIAVLSPVADPMTQAITARVVIDNTDGLWRPGMIVKGHVAVSTRDVPLAVKNTGLQPFRDFTVVFAKVGDTYEVRMLDLGESDGVHTEVLSGLKPGTAYVTGNSFLIRADIEKSGASHDH